MVSELPPKLAGLEVGEIRARMRDAADVMTLSMQRTVEEWRREQEEARKAAASADDEEPAPKARKGPRKRSGRVR